MVYEIGGKIDIERTIGQKCETGAFVTQSIKGYGDITKTETINIAPYIMSIDQKMDWTVPSEALEGLTVTTTIELCARPMSVSVYDEFPITTATGIYLNPEWIHLYPPFFFPAEYIYQDLLIGQKQTDLSAYTTNWFGQRSSLDNISMRGLVMRSVLFPEEYVYLAPVYELLGYQIEAGDIISPYHPLVIDGTITVSSLTKQIWATEIITDQGHVGSYHADLVAAYGPGPYEERGIRSDIGGDFTVAFIDEDLMWGYIGRHPSGKIRIGERYVGNYFDIEQYANTTSGEMHRITSMSDPLHNLFFEDEYSIVDGSAEVREAFSMHILPRGPRGERFDWWAIY